MKRLILLMSMLVVSMGVVFANDTDAAQGFNLFGLDLAEMISMGVTIIGGWLGVNMVKFRKKFKQAVVLIKEVNDVAEVGDQAMADNQLTPEEVRLLLKELKEMISAGKKLLNIDKEKK